MVQIVNLACWIGPNAYLVTVSCRWNGWNNQYINAFGTLRWTCWCVTILVLRTSALSLCAILPHMLKLHCLSAQALVLQGQQSGQSHH